MIFALLITTIYASEPVGLYLTWYDDPTTTMTIQWITPLDQKRETVSYRKSGSEGQWGNLIANFNRLPQNYRFQLHRADIKDLSPDTLYEFKLSSDPTIYRFRTMPTHLTRPVKFVEGGDLYHDTIDILRETNLQAAKRDPDFIILGGDLAYASEKFPNLPEKGNRWLEFMAEWKRDMVGANGRLIPLVPLIGNHDANGRREQTPEQAVFYYSFFVPDQMKSYRNYDFGDYMKVVVLDSGHTNSIGGQQQEWLRAQLKDNKFPFTVVAYHVPAYPSVRPFDGTTSTSIRELWVPLFEAGDVTVAFEHHDHAYKRSKKIKNNKEDPEGVLYLGDGAWGMTHPRLPNSPSKLWYLEKSAAARHFIEVVLEPNQWSFKAIDSGGQVIDEQTYPVKSLVPAA
jgi:hypothetical protein